MRLLPLVLASAAMSALVAPASAEGLFEAIEAAYATNPELAAARAAARQVDESVSIARSEMRPSLNGVITFNQDFFEFSDFGRIANFGVQLEQPVFAGGRIRRNISAAEARVGAAREQLRALENRIIGDTVAAYADVLATRAEVELNRNQVRLLENELRASSDRFEVGDVTRTDVAQSEAQLEDARARLVIAEGQALTAEQAFIRIVGRPPGQLDPLPDLPPLPGNDMEARDVALASNPDLMAARFSETAAGETVRVVRNERFPTIGVTAGMFYQAADGGPFAAFRPDGKVNRIDVRATMPLLTGGAISARTRQAQAAQSEAIENIEVVSRLVVESTVNAMIALRAAESVIRSLRIAIDASALASEGVRQENLVGARDVIEVLRAEQDLLNTRVALVRAERDRYVAAYRLLQVLGRAEVAILGVTDRLYDPAVNFRRVARRWQEFGQDPRPVQDRARNRPPGAPEPEERPPQPRLRMGP
ncbi:MAG: TolC family outer membrane protein [Sphingomonadaceae bacterium]